MGRSVCTFVISRNLLPLFHKCLRGNCDSEFEFFCSSTLLGDLVRGARFADVFALCSLSSNLNLNIPELVETFWNRQPSAQFEQEAELVTFNFLEESKVTHNKKQFSRYVELWEYAIETWILSSFNGFLLLLFVSVLVILGVMTVSRISKTC